MGLQGYRFLCIVTVLNDISQVISILPRHPASGHIAFIRRANDKSPKGLRYNPFKVLRALRWLIENNSEYANIVTEICHDINWENDGIDKELEFPFIPADEEDYEGLEHSLSNDDEGLSMNLGAPTHADFFLQKVDNSYDLLDEVRNIIAGNNPTTLIPTRNNGEFVKDYNTKSFLQKAFPIQYPYGKGYQYCLFLKTIS